MSKRFTDTEMWDKVWFRKSKPKYKCFIKYLFDKCNHAGIWEVDKDKMEFYVYDKFRESLDDLLEMYSDHIIRVSDSKWFLVDFIPFQYKCRIEDLNPKNKVHKSVADILDKYNVVDILRKLSEDKPKGFGSPLQGDKDKDKNIYKDKDKDKDKDVKKRYLDFVFLSDKEHEKLNLRYGEETTDRFVASLNDYIGSKGRKYKSHYYTILVWMRKDGVQEIKRKAEQKKEYKIPKEEERSPETEKKVKNMIKQIKIKKAGDA